MKDITLSPETNKCLPAEWSQQQAVLLALPHADTDWAYMLDDVLACFRDIAKAIAPYAHMVILAPATQDLVAVLGDSVPADRYTVVEYVTNDTWARDFGPICIHESTDAGQASTAVLDYVFNGWGMKFAADRDNLATNALLHKGIIRKSDYRDMRDFVLEGGAIDSDGKGSLLTTSECLLSPNRNATLSRSDIEKRLCRDFGISRVLWLDHGYLAGDDTDSHVDTLARFLPDSPDDISQIAYTSCDRSDDEHFDALRRMESQLKEMCDHSGRKYDLISLPIPEAIFDEDGERLPATYANFLIINGAIIVPIYGDEHYDSIALKKIKAALPLYDVVAVDCRALIRQHGSLHCMTMQVPAGAINV